MGICPRCRGRGVLVSERVEGDGIGALIMNIGRKRITCPTCGGTGLISERIDVYVHYDD